MRRSRKRTSHSEANSSSKFVIHVNARSDIGCFVQELMTTVTNKVRGHSSHTFVAITRILHAPSSSLIAFALNLSTSNIISKPR